MVERSGDKKRGGQQDKKAYGRFLKQLPGSNGRNVTDFARNIGVSIPTIRDWIHKAREAGLEVSIEDGELAVDSNIPANNIVDIEDMDGTIDTVRIIRTSGTIGGTKLC